MDIKKKHLDAHVSGAMKYYKTLQHFKEWYAPHDGPYGRNM
jgi:hypothetical protein